MSEWKKSDDTEKTPDTKITEKLNEAEAHLKIKMEELLKQRDMWINLLKQKSEEK